MKRTGWTRNLRLKIGAVVVALVTTLGFYGLIQANPLTHANTTSAPASSTDTTTSAPSTDNGSQAFAPAPAPVTSGSADGSAFAPAPVSRMPVTRTRHS
jgi:hypothetical protein